MNQRPFRLPALRRVSTTALSVLAGAITFGLAPAVLAQTWVTPTTQASFLPPEPYVGSEQFGASIDMDGSRIAFGSPGATITDLTAAGAVYIFEGTPPENPVSAVQTGYLTAPVPARTDQFGFSVGISGDWAIVGARFNDAAATNAGAVYLYRRSPEAVWTYVQTITAPDAAAQDQFGNSVAISGGYAVIGAPFSGAGGSKVGAVYVYKWSEADSLWVFASKISSPNPVASDFFGRAVDIDGTRILVGAPQADAPNPGGSGVITDSGLAFVFESDGATTPTWTSVATLAAYDPAPTSNYANSLALSGDRIVIGCSLDDSSGENSGAAYIYERNEIGQWIIRGKPNASDGAAGDQYGYDVAISGDIIAIGSPHPDGTTPGDGAVYVLRRENFWGEYSKLRPTDYVAPDAVGSAVDALLAPATNIPWVAAGVPNKEIDPGIQSGVSYLFAFPALPKDPPTGWLAQ